MKANRITIFCVALVLAVVATSHADSASDAEALAQRVKAAFIYNFIQFTDWPEGALGEVDSPIVIGVLDPDPLGGNLEKTIAGKTAHGHPLKVKYINDPTQVAGCHLIYACGDDGPVRKILAAATGSVLTVGDSDAFAEAGGEIRFYLADNKIRFEINLTAVEKQKLQVSSKLLKVAKTVRH